jgi:D-alanyl-D-alanine carboxypeptidase
VDVWLAEGTPVTPGVSVAVLLPDGTEMLVASGLADLVAQEPVTTDDYFRIGSISKTITSVAMLQLVSEGHVDLDEPVATYVGDLLDGYVLDGVDYGDQVTVRQVLNHTDGFAEYAFDLGFYLLMSERLETVVEPEEIVDWAISMGPQYVPGTAYSYNTVGHNVVGLIIESVTGQPAHEVLRERIFDPLGLDDIFLPPAEDPPEPVVHGYAATVLKAALDAIPTTASYPEADLGDVYDISVVPQEAIRSAGWTGGSIEAQVLDVARIFRAMFDGTLLDDAMVAEFLTTSEFSDYGLGISVGEADVNTVGAAVVVAEDAVSYSHGGGVPGFRSHAAYFPDHDITIAVSANVLPADPDVGELADRILGALLNEAELEPLPASDDSDALGAILDSEPVDLGGWLHLGEAWRVVYRSEAVNGNPIEVTGVIIAPADSTDDARPVLSITHGTTGLADGCAPSLGFPDDYIPRIHSSPARTGLGRRCHRLRGTRRPGPAPLHRGRERGPRRVRHRPCGPEGARPRCRRPARRLGPFTGWPRSDARRRALDGPCPRPGSRRRGRWSATIPVPAPECLPAGRRLPGLPHDGRRRPRRRLRRTRPGTAHRSGVRAPAR